MFDAALRPLKDRLLRPVARGLGAVPPLVVTAAGLALGLAAAWLAWRGALAAGAVCWLANRVLDGLDGVLAREQRTASDFGGYADLLADFLVYALVPIGLALGTGRPDVIAAALWLLASFYLNALSWTYLSAVLERRRAAPAPTGQTSIVIPDAIIGGTETIVFYTAFFLLPAYLVPLFSAMAALVGAGVVLRFAWAARHL